MADLHSYSTLFYKYSAYLLLEYILPGCIWFVLHIQRDTSECMHYCERAQRRGSARVRDFTHSWNFADVYLELRRTLSYRQIYVA